MRNPPTHARATVDGHEVEFPWAGWPDHLRPSDGESPDAANARGRFFDRLAREAAGASEASTVDNRRLCRA